MESKVSFGKRIVLIAVLLLAGAGTWYLVAPPSDKGEAASSPLEKKELSASASVDAASRRVGAKDDSSIPQTRQEAASTEDADSPEEEEPQTEEEKAAAAAEAKVEAFDDLTDKWLEPTKAGVTMKDVDAFADTFRQVPKDRQDECIHRALNLIPDDNVMLLAGVLMDKTMDKEIVETVFNDVLNRDEDVKKPILQQIFKDKTHPCWADTAWILDVTGEHRCRDSKSIICPFD